MPVSSSESIASEKGEDFEQVQPETGRELAEALRLELNSGPEGDEGLAKAGRRVRGFGANGVGARGPGDICSIPLAHINYIEKARGELPDTALTSGLASLFKVFSDPTRIRLLSALSATELCVCDLGALLGMSQSAVSHQLAILRASGVVRSRRDGKVVWYSLDDYHVAGLLAMGLEHLGETKQREKGPQA